MRKAESFKQNSESGMLSKIINNESQKLKVKAQTEEIRMLNGPKSES